MAWFGLDSKLAVRGSLWPKAESLMVGLRDRAEPSRQIVEAEELACTCEIAYSDSIAQVTGRWMEKDPTVVVLGEDIANLGGGPYDRRRLPAQAAGQPAGPASPDTVADPAALAQCAKLAEARGYDEINLNVGCPSDRVQNGMFGACLMGNAQLVADCVKAMRDVVSIPVTVKTRIGIDDQDSYEFLCDFINTVSGKGECEMFIIHARKAWLSGLSPKENREIPPLDYPRVYQLKRDFPHLTMSINGGIKSLEEAKAHLQHMDGVMVGREAYHRPLMMAEWDRRFFGPSAAPAAQHSDPGDDWRHEREAAHPAGRRGHRAVGDAGGRSRTGTDQEQSGQQSQAEGCRAHASQAKSTPAR